jgi:probable F420-dependent oxidoreductase
MPPLREPIATWRDRLRRIEDLGFSTVSISDHLTGGWQMDPIVAMTVAAEATSRLRVLSMVFCNDLRHPAVLHRSMANLDVFSGGRVEIGLGAGWNQDDYRATGIGFDPAPERIDRLAESVEVIKLLFGAEPVSYPGKHYQITELTGLPRPVQRPHPPLLVGGGGRRVLELAGRLADIVGVNPRLATRAAPPAAADEMTPGRLAQKLGWVRAAATAAGRDPATIELQLSLLDLRLRHGGIEHVWTSSLAHEAGSDTLAGSPAALSGDLDQCVDALLERRERYGISYYNLGGNLRAAGPLVVALAGR